MIMVTAMVSPSARPRARMVAPKMPAGEAGRIPRQVVSHQVAPRAVEASFRPPGTDRMTSRDTEARVGRTITARTSAAQKRLVGRGVPAKRGIQPRWLLSG